MITNQGAEFVSVDRPRKISDFVYTTGELYGPPKEQSLIINSKKGLIVITGCAHPGVVNIVKKAKEIFPEEKVCLVLGGFHLGGVSDSKLKSIVSDFRKLGVEKVAPSHCSGDRCRELFKEEYKEDFIECGVGKIIEVVTKSKPILRNLDILREIDRNAILPDDLKPKLKRGAIISFSISTSWLHCKRWYRRYSDNATVYDQYQHGEDYFMNLQG